MRILLSFLILICPSLCHAQCLVRNRVISKQVVINEIVTPVALIVPLYSASYVPSTVAQSAPASGTDLERILQKLDALEKRMDAAAGTNKANKVEAHPGLAILNNKCASCHEAAKATSGAPPFLINGQLAQTIPGYTSIKEFSADIHSDLFRETMPKKGDKLTQEEHAQVLDYFESLKGVKK